MVKVSIVMPVYNGERFLREAIESVFQQSFKDFEFIAVNDGSTDGSFTILKKFPEIQIISQGNGGQSAARNAGVAHSQGAFIAFIDQDDKWYPQKLTRQVQLLEQNPQIGLVYGDLDEIDEHGKLITKGMIATFGLKHPKRSINDCLSRDLFIVPSSVVLRKSLFEKAGGFDERLSGYEDDDLFLRLFPLTHFHFMPESVTQWRIYRSSSSHSERMDVSRAIYMQKLIQRFPDQPSDGKHYARDLIVPRFIKTYLACYWRAQETNQKDRARRYREELFSLLGPYMGVAQRLLCAVLMGPRSLSLILRAVVRSTPNGLRQRVRM
jgi:glycosyltransferase involved in cell wall biosynthesis